jgi:hypothetical protein
MLRKWCSRYLNAITLCVHAGFLLALLLVFPEPDTSVWQLFLFASLFLSLYAWHFNFRRLLAIVEHPTSTIAAAAQGYVEFKGRARQLLPMRSPLTQTPCVWFRYWVYVKDHNNVWRLADYLSSEQEFELEDLTGRCVVDPTNAEIMMAERHAKTQHDHRYIELIIREGKSIYVLGELETITAQTAAQKINREVSELLADWKKVPERLKKRFDFNGDGTIDMDEWAHAREAAAQEVLVKNGLADQQEKHKIRAPRDHRLFLISAVSPEQLRARYKFWTGMHLTFATVAALLVLMLGYGHAVRSLW